MKRDRTHIVLENGKILNKTRNLLVQALKKHPDTGYLRELPPIRLEDWKKILELACKHNVSPFLYYRIKKLNGMDIPPEILKLLRADYLQNTIRNMRIYHQLGTILKKLHEENIPVIPLKGAFLAQNIYSEIGLRPMADVDLLILKKDIKGVGDILEKLNYHPTSGLDEVIPEEYQFGYVGRKTGLFIELHWDLIERTYPTCPDIALLWENSSPSKLGGAHIREMSPEEHLIYLCIHSSRHTLSYGLKTMCDIQEILCRYWKELDWNLLLTIAKQWKATHSLSVHLGLVEKLLNIALPKDVTETINLPTLQFAEQCLFENTEEPRKALPAMEKLVKLWKEKGIYSKYRKLWEAVIPSRKFLSARYPVSPNSWRIILCYPIRIKDLIKRHGKVALELFRSKPGTIARANLQYQLDSFKDWLLSA